MSLQLQAQNIVPNGGFEEMVACPNGSGQIFRAPPWISSLGSSDLYNECGILGYGAPVNVNGTQIPHQGSGYAGAGCYFVDFVDVREFLKCTLNYPLVDSEEYYVEFYVSHNDSSQFATHNLGVTFTDVDTGKFGELLCWPDCDAYVENTSANPLTSKTEWMKVSGTFTAQGGERYIHIGNFRTDDDSEIEFIGGGVGPDYVWNFAAYYVDDVWLSHIDSMGYVSVNEQLAIGNEQYLVYPNPTADGSLYLQHNLTPSGATTWQLTDLRGRVLLSQPVGTSIAEFDVSHLSSGVYFSRLLEDGVPLHTDKVVIK